VESEKPATDEGKRILACFTEGGGVLVMGVTVAGSTTRGESSGYSFLHTPSSIKYSTSILWISLDEDGVTLTSVAGLKRALSLSHNYVM